MGAILAGGEGSRLGRGSKPGALLRGRPLVAYPLEALQPVCERLAVVCKPSTELPELPPGVERWDEPEEPRHPLTGIVHALATARAAVLVCAADMPFVTTEAARTLLEAAERSARTTVVAVADGRLQPTFAIYGEEALAALRSAEPNAPLTRTVEALEPARVALPAATVRSVNTPEDLAAAEELLAG